LTFEEVVANEKAEKKRLEDEAKRLKEEQEARLIAQQLEEEERMIQQAIAESLKAMPNPE
jgi:hypothetical protein